MADLAFGLVVDGIKGIKAIYDQTKEFEPITKALLDTHERFAERLKSVAVDKKAVDEVSVDEATTIELCETHAEKLKELKTFVEELKAYGRVDRVVFMRKIENEIAVHREAIEKLGLDLDVILERANATNIKQANRNSANVLLEIAELKAESRQWKLEMQRMLTDVYKAHQVLPKHLEKPGMVYEESRAATFARSLTMLKFEITERKDDNAPEHLQVMEAIYAQFEMAEFRAPEYAPWFVSLNDVTFDPDNKPFPDKEYIHVCHGSFDGMRVAIKQMRIKDDFKATNQFKRELKMWSKANHENVARLYGACDAESPAFFVYEYASKGDFFQFFHDNGKSQIWRLFYQAALGLKHLHRKKIIHGDLRCANLLVGKDGLAKVSGFGFSYQRQLSAGLSAKAQADSIRWKAPECLLLTDDPDQTNPRWASDVYSFGMAIWEAANGTPPYDTLDEDTIMEEKLAGNSVDRPDDLEDDEWAFVQSMLQFEWDKRPTIDNVVAQLRSFDKRASWRSSRALNLSRRPKLDVSLTSQAA